MKLMHFAVLLGLLGFIGCEENTVEDDIPATMPGQYDSDVGDRVNDGYEVDGGDQL